MERLVASFILAFLIHALLLSWKGPVPKPESAPELRRVTMTLFRPAPPAPEKRGGEPPGEKRIPETSLPSLPEKKAPAPSVQERRKPSLKPLEAKPEPIEEERNPPENSAPTPEPVSEASPSSRPESGQDMANVAALHEASPLYKQNPPPRYPAAAIRRGYSGTVLLQVRVTESGYVREIRVAESSGYPMLDSAALKAVKSWAFEPGRKGKTPIEMWVNVPVVFRLDAP